MIIALWNGGESGGEPHTRQVRASTVRRTHIAGPLPARRAPHEAGPQGLAPGRHGPARVGEAVTRQLIAGLVTPGLVPAREDVPGQRGGDGGGRDYQGMGKTEIFLPSALKFRQ